MQAAGKGRQKSQIKVACKILFSKLINPESLALNSRHIKLIFGRHARSPVYVSKAPICTAAISLGVVHVHESGIVFSQNHSSLKTKLFLPLHSISLCFKSNTIRSLLGLKENISISFQFPSGEKSNNADSAFDRSALRKSSICSFELDGTHQKEYPMRFLGVRSQTENTPFV